jgi:hypothetical protein
MLLAEELALVARRPDKGRPALGVRSYLNACLAALSVAELVLDGVARPGPSGEAMTVTDVVPSSSILAAAARVLTEKGPRIKAILSGMDRGLRRQLGAGTWDTLAAGLPLDARDAIVDRLRAATRGDDEIEPRTALVLSMIGPAYLLGVVAPGRGPARRHARDRIDHALDGTSLEVIGRTVRALIAEANAAAGAAAVVATGG